MRSILGFCYFLCDIDCKIGARSREFKINPNDFFNECLRPMASIIATLLTKRDDLPCYYHIGVILAHFIALEEEICS